MNEMKDNTFPPVRIASDLKIIYSETGLSNEAAEPPFYHGWEVWDLYSDGDRVGYFTKARTDGVREYVDVLISVSYIDKKTDRVEHVDLVVRLPDGLVLGAKYPSNPDFCADDLQNEDIAAEIQKLHEDEDIIFALGKKVQEPDFTVEDLNALRDKIGGKIYRCMPLECPYCHGSLVGEQVAFTVNIPVSFYMHSGNFGIKEADVYQNVVDAVQRGDVTGECLICHHEITAEDINKEKTGWQYRWRYDPHK